MVELSGGASVALGVMVGLASTSIQSVGLTLQRKSHLLEEEKDDDDDRRPPYKRRRWQLGMLMFVVANIVGSTIQITTLPLPVLSTLQASGLVFNSICASIILSEPFTQYSLIGTMLVAIGALLIALFGAIAEPSHNLDQLLVLLGRKHFLVWMIMTGVAVVLLLFATWLLKHMYPRTTPRLRLVRGMFFGCISGILSAHSLLIAKSAVELLVRTIVDRHNEFNRWQSWMILIGLVVFALTQLYYMHCGLKLCSTSVLYPLVFCIYNIIAIIDGLIYFNQGDRLSSLHAGLIALGTVILLAGVVCLSWRLEDNEEEPTSPVASKHGRVQLPQTALQPGLGLAHSHSVDEPASPLDRDEEASAGQKPLDERTPLLAKTPRGSALSLVNAKKRAMEAGGQKSPQLNTPRKSSRRRRMTLTLSEETNEIWDELNDRETLPSPARQSVDLERRPRSGTLPPRRNNAQSAWLNHMRRRSWFEGLGSRQGRSVSQGKLPADSSPLLLNHPDPDDGDTSDADIMESSSRRNTWGYGSGQADKSQEALGDWFKLKWWRKKWREDEEHDGRDEDDQERRT
ncbi:Mg-trans-NIPA domain containing protein [Pyrenophora tritici-repentis]|uniref:Magnesium transporter NIPA n=2 Tax=Pyrenophora tritici-repentis TaxID=45151 RepID=A0A2W1DDB4_9PLEO|nr:uncharacterized protein PTRG_05370 [Pyrenophora tritici-repentis Pt-1C-BFP]KAA8618432.1 Mg-trans-NIPA multi-domain protein [Pyrenophora tritici-repentis]EDU48290.1 conserved hypothetical protein [Pyrenophora tritici-repentis Pt-1C-BFP]KAF7448904.1 Mg-trans-NIPA multi-domain protein [Pyrenophora tritici-repentis]KAF7571100.1 Mg-trans-NIPA multi-domain protein [Pyrenophora tritici-repentis]KAG9384154.1 Mg-trans-NIPA multi-domain protein [Pyrenophora tritici-repentis]